jgi:methylated-DNA-[protein]-cysteine S-methyltransferase
MGGARMSKAIDRATIPSPVGPLVATCESGAVSGLRFEPDQSGPVEAPVQSSLLDELQRQLDLYWDGRLREFTVPLAPRGTPFQLAVWRALVTIPYGETMSYKELADSIGRPRAVRAVGRANGANPIAIVIPCHRVVGATGSLTGYGGGLEAKRALLELEESVDR